MTPLIQTLALLCLLSTGHTKPLTFRNLMDSESILVPLVEPRLPSFLPSFLPEGSNDRSIVFNLVSSPDTIQRQLSEALARGGLEPEMVSYLRSYSQERLQQQRELVRRLRGDLFRPRVLLKEVSQEAQEEKVVILETHTSKS